MTTEQRTASADAQQIPTDIRPQDDLYLHVNGDWIASHTIPDDRSADGVIRGLFDVAEEKVRDIITHAGESSGSEDRKSTRLNSSHVATSYAVFCLKKKITKGATAITSSRS